MNRAVYSPGGHALLGLDQLRTGPAPTWDLGNDIHLCRPNSRLHLCRRQHTGCEPETETRHNHTPRVARGLNGIAAWLTGRPSITWDDPATICGNCYPDFNNPDVPTDQDAADAHRQLHDLGLIGAITMIQRLADTEDEPELAAAAAYGLATQGTRYLNDFTHRYTEDLAAAITTKLATIAAAMTTRQARMVQDGTGPTRGARHARTKIERYEQNAAHFTFAGPRNAAAQAQVSLHDAPTHWHLMAADVNPLNMWTDPFRRILPDDDNELVQEDAGSFWPLTVMWLHGSFTNELGTFALIPNTLVATLLIPEHPLAGHGSFLTDLGTPTPAEQAAIRNHQLPEHIDFAIRLARSGYQGNALRAQDELL